MNPFQEIFDKQKAYFDSDATKPYEWRVDQLTRLENLLKDNSRALEDAVGSDFKTAVQEKGLRGPGPARIDHVLASLPFGGGAVNQVNIHLFIETMPFGGVGHSGLGRYYGKAGFDALTHAKSVLVSPPDVAIDHLFPPPTRRKRSRH